MADKNPSDRNAHEPLPGDGSEQHEDVSDETVRRAEKNKRNPLSDLRFGSAGSGGAEREPGPERP
jgi:hypothetical protein